MRNPALFQVLGPLALFAEGFRERLEMLGYAPQPRVVHLRVMAHLSSWLEERGLDGSALSASVTDGFIHDRRVAGHRDARSGRSLRPLLEYLREIGAAPQPVPQQAVGPVEEVLADYAAYLIHERGLGVLTVQRSTDLVRLQRRVRRQSETDVGGTLTRASGRHGLGRPGQGQTYDGGAEVAE